MAVTNQVLLIAIFAAVCAVAHAGNWTIVQDKYITIGMAASFQSQTSGWLPGSRGDGTVAFHFTTDSGKTLQTANSSFAEGMPISVAMVNSSYGVVGLVGLFNLLPSAAITVDGKTWNSVNIGKTIVAAFQGASASSDGTLVLAGQWTTTSATVNGIALSTDGKSWAELNWNQGTVPARYVSFINSQTGWVSGGSWPETNDTLTHDMTQYMFFRNGKFGMRAPAMRKGDNPQANYTAVIARTNDGGKTWTTQLNLANQGLYFNAIQFVNTNQGWAVAEGVDQNGEPIAYIYGTKNGGSSWSVLKTLQYGSLLTVSFTDANNGWVGGVDLSTGSSLALFTTNGGNSWTASNSVKNFFFSQISAVSGGVAYGAGINRVGVSSLARYQ